MSGTKGAEAHLISNGYATIRPTGGSIQVIGWYTPPWLARVMSPIWIVSQLAVLWIMFRVFTPAGARSFQPRLDYWIGLFVNVFVNPIHSWLVPNDWNFGKELTLSLMFGSLASIVVIMLLSRLLSQQGGDMTLLAKILRFPLRVEILPDRIVIGRRSFERTGIEGFSKDLPSVVKNNQPRNQAYDRSMAIILETGIAKIPIAEVFGIARAEGIILALQEAMRMSRKL
jgi:hypothetical protein